MRRAAAVMAEARPSKLLVAKPRGSLTSTTTTSSGRFALPPAKGQGRRQPVECRADDDDVLKLCHGASSPLFGPEDRRCGVAAINDAKYRQD